jgi:uncharacterized protein (UPF0276 family)
MDGRELGVGLVWWPTVDELCHDAERLVDVIEVEPESFWAPNADGDGFRSFPRSALDHLPQPKLLHGVGAPLAGTCLPPAGHTSAFAKDVADLHPEYISEHLSLTHFRTTTDWIPWFSGFMLPPLQSTAGVALAAANVRRRRAALGNIPIAVETPVSYLPVAPDEWPDGDFVAAVAEQADCGILLDLHNVLCNSRNGRQGIAAFCHSLPLDRVWEVHLAGGEYDGTYCLDAHSGVAEPELMEFAAALVKRLPQLRAITLEIMPDRVAHVGLDAIARQLGDIREIWNTRGTECEPISTETHSRSWTGPPVSPQTWETLLGTAISNLSEPPLVDMMAAWRSSAAPAVGLYRKLVGEARASALVSAAPRCTRLLLRAHGGAGTRRILAAFWRQSPPGYTAVDEARSFLRFLSQEYPTLPGLPEAMADDTGTPAVRPNHRFQSHHHPPFG